MYAGRMQQQNLVHDVDETTSMNSKANLDDLEKSASKVQQYLEYNAQ